MQLVSRALTQHYHTTEKEINIYVGLTEMQRKWYRSVLEKDIDAVNGKSHLTRSSNYILTLYPRSLR